MWRRESPPQACPMKWMALENPFSMQCQAGWAEDLRQLAEHLLDALTGPFKSRARDHQRRGEPDRGGVGFLAEQSLLHERFAEASSSAGFRMKLQSNPQSLTAHFLDSRVANLTQSVQEPLTL